VTPSWFSHRGPAGDYKSWPEEPQSRADSADNVARGTQISLARRSMSRKGLGRTRVLRPTTRGRTSPFRRSEPRAGAFGAQPPPGQERRRPQLPQRVPSPARSDVAPAAGRQRPSRVGRGRADTSSSHHGARSAGQRPPAKEQSPMAIASSSIARPASTTTPAATPPVIRWVRSRPSPLSVHARFLLSRYFIVACCRDVRHQGLPRPVSGR
jgi:hypothetical protein